MRRFPQPDPDTVEIIDIHCYGCGRRMGVTQQELPRRSPKSYCSELCWHREQLDSENATRDRLIRVMADHGFNNSLIGETFGIHRTRVIQILAVGNDEDYLLAGRRK